MNLTPAETWNDLRPPRLDYDLETRLLFIRQIQADALRWAVYEIQDFSDPKLGMDAILKKANQLDPVREKS